MDNNFMKESEFYDTLGVLEKENHIDAFVAFSRTTTCVSQQISNIASALFSLGIVGVVVCFSISSMGLDLAPTTMEILSNACILLAFINFVGGICCCVGVIAWSLVRALKQKEDSTLAAPYSVSDGTYISHYVRSSGSSNTTNKSTLYVIFRDERGKKHETKSHLINRDYFDRMEKGASLKVVTVYGILNRPGYVVMVPEFFSEGPQAN